MIGRVIAVLLALGMIAPVPRERSAAFRKAAADYRRRRDRAVSDHAAERKARCGS